MAHPWYLLAMPRRKAHETLLEKVHGWFVEEEEPSFADAERLRRATYSTCAEKVIRALKLPNGERFMAVRVREYTDPPRTEISNELEEARKPIALPIMLGELKSRLRAPDEPKFRKAALEFLNLAIRRSGANRQWTTARLRFELREARFGVQDWYEVEKTHDQVNIRHHGARGPTEKGRADTKKLVHLICERGVICKFRGCEGRGEGRCPQPEEGCTREASDETVAAISLLLAPIERYAQALKKGKNTVSKVIAAEEEATRKVRSRKGISRAAKGKKRAG